MRFDRSLLRCSCVAHLLACVHVRLRMQGVSMWGRASVRDCAFVRSSLSWFMPRGANLHRSAVLQLDLVGREEAPQSGTDAVDLYVLLPDLR